MMAQVAPRVGDIKFNTRLVLGAMQRAEDAHCDMLVLPELVLTGYPPEDLLLRHAFMREVDEAVAQIVANARQAVVVFGHPRLVDGDLFNSATLAANGKLVGVYDKRALPNYGVFDELRYFTAGSGADVFEVHGWRIGVGICEDLWDDELAESVASRPRDVLLNLNASPFHLDKQLEREALMQRRAVRFGVPAVYVNPVGGAGRDRVRWWQSCHGCEWRVAGAGTNVRMCRCAGGCSCELWRGNTNAGYNESDTLRAGARSTRLCAAQRLFAGANRPVRGH